MRYDLYRLTPAVPQRMTLDDFCERFNCSLSVTEMIGGTYRFTAILLGISFGDQAIGIAGENYGPGDPRGGGGQSPTEAIRDCIQKLQGLTVYAHNKSNQKIVMPTLDIGELIPIDHVVSHP